MSEPLQKKRKTVIDNDENDEDSATSDVSFPFYPTPSASHFTIELAKIWSKLLLIMGPLVSGYLTIISKNDFPYV